VVLLYPRRSVHEGDISSVERFKRIGRRLLDRHVLFDILPDDIATSERLADYRAVVKVSHAGNEREILDVDGLDLSRFEAPATVRVSASRPAVDDELTVHFVNYDRTEPKEKRSAGSGIVDERPRRVSGIRADLRLPPGTHVTALEVLSPEYDAPRGTSFEVAQGRVRFRMLEFLVYGVARVHLRVAE
jgi:hypothetical protein